METVYGFFIIRFNSFLSVLNSCHWRHIRYRESLRYRGETPPLGCRPEEVSVRFPPGAQRGLSPSFLFLKLARRGLDVVLVSRCSTKLQNVAKQIGESHWKEIKWAFDADWNEFIFCLPHPEGEYGRKTRTIQADFTDGDSVYPAIAQGLHGLEIGILGKCTCGF